MYGSSDVIELKRGQKIYFVRSQASRLAPVTYAVPATWARPEANRHKFSEMAQFLQGCELPLNVVK
jgi:hypothetical protein